MRSRAVLAGAAAMLWAAPLLAGPRVVSLDQCADQYVLAMTPRADIAGLSTRAMNNNSYLRLVAKGLPERRATAESVLAARPDVVVRYWGGDVRLVSDLERRGVRVLTIDDATDFGGVRADIRRLAQELNAPVAGQTVASMDAQLAAARGAGGGRGVYYFTSGGDTLGPGTLVDAMIRAAGFANLRHAPAGARSRPSVWSSIRPRCSCSASLTPTWRPRCAGASGARRRSGG